MALPARIRAFRVVAMAGSAFLAVVCGELVVRRFYPLPTPQPPLYKFDGELGWVESPGLDVVVRSPDGREIRVRTNRQSFRGPDRSLQKNPSRTRIVIFGDSFTEALGVREEDAYPFLLEAALNREQTRYEVFGLGVSSYGTVQELLWLRRVVDRYRPDVVVFQVCVNDFWDNIRGLSYQVRGPWAEEAGEDGSLTIVPVSLAPDSSVPAPRAAWRKPLSWLKWNSALVHTSLATLQGRERSRTAIAPSDAKRAPVDPRRDPRFGDSRRVTSLLLEQAATECSRRGIRFLAYLNPSTLRYSNATTYQANGLNEAFHLDSEIESWLYEGVLEHCRARSIPCVWPSTLFAEAIEKGQAVTLRADSHWNEVGHRLVALDLLIRIEAFLGKGLGKEEAH